MFDLTVLGMVKIGRIPNLGASTSYEAMRLTILATLF